MITTDSKLFFGVAGALAVAAIAYAIGSMDRMGAIILATAAAGAILVGALTTGRVRPAAAELAAPAPNRSSDPLASTLWPPLCALGAVVFLVGLTVDIPTLTLGLVALAAAAGGWFAQVWREHRDAADPAALYAEQRVVNPAGLPLLAVLTVALVVISVSRVLLAVPKEAATALAIVGAGGIFVVAILVAARASLSGRALVGLLAATGVLVVIGGVVAAGTGEREIERHASAEVTEVARGVAFVEKDLEVVAETGRVIIHFQNEDADQLHNIAVYTDEAADETVFFGPEINGIGERTYAFDIEPGEYFYRCEFHIDTMTGTLTVEEGHHDDEGGEDPA